MFEYDSKKNKRRCFRSHARNRLWERYQIAMDNQEWQAFKSKTSEAKFIKKLTDVRVLRALPYKDKMLYFIWDKNVGEIVTFIPKEDSRITNSLII